MKNLSLELVWNFNFQKYKQKQILDEVSHDVITDVIGSIEDEDEKNAFLELLGDDDKEDVKQLLQYNPETAGGIMTTEYLDIHAKNTVKETLLSCKQQMKNQDIISMLLIKIIS